jgi:hypothetical protein
MKAIGKFILAFSLVLMIFQESKGQDEEYLKGRFFLSPDFGLMFGSTTRIEISPAFGYYLNDRLGIAGGFVYEYYKQSGNYFSNYETSIYGPKAFARFTLIKNLGEFLPIESSFQILAHIEYESLSLDEKYFSRNITPGEGRFWYSTALIGGGISQSGSGRIKLNALILWDVDANSISPYNNPIFRLGIQFIFRNKFQ